MFILLTVSTSVLAQKYNLIMINGGDSEGGGEASSAVNLWLFENNLDNEVDGGDTLTYTGGSLSYNSNTEMEGNYNADLSSTDYLSATGVEFTDEWTIFCYYDAGNNAVRGIMEWNDQIKIWADYTNGYIEGRTGPDASPTGDFRSNTISEPFEYDPTPIAVRRRDAGGGTYYISVFVKDAYNTYDSIAGAITTGTDDLNIGYAFSGSRGYSDLDAFHHYNEALTDAEIYAIFDDPSTAQ